MQTPESAKRGKNMIIRGWLLAGKSNEDWRAMLDEVLACKVE